MFRKLRRCHVLGNEWVVNDRSLAQAQSHTWRQARPALFQALFKHHADVPMQLVLHQLFQQCACCWTKAYGARSWRKCLLKVRVRSSLCPVTLLTLLQRTLQHARHQETRGCISKYV